jgi:Domain of unknown function (DUF4232)
MLTTPPAPPLTSGRTSGRSRGRHAVSLAVTAAAAAGLLAGCASASTHPAAAAPAGGAASSKTATAGGTAAGTGPATSGTVGLALCQPSSLQVTVNASQAGGAAGSTYLPVDFTNTSSSPCGLYGYPGMSFVTAGDGSGSQIGAAAQKNPSFGKVPVRLAAGGVAHAWLQVAEAGNYPAATCQPVTAHWLRVYAPGETQALYVSHAFDACSSDSAPLLTVMPVRSGQGVQGTTP